ncbi:MAG: enoyl-CoA hydratase-related protein, partial [Pseudomonadota bacterium]
MSAYEDLLYEVQDGVAIATLNRPAALNAFTAAMGQSLRRAMADAIADKAVRAIVLTGAGRGFCAGADLNLLKNVAPGTRSTLGAGDAQQSLHSGLGPDVGPLYGGRFGYLLQAGKPVVAAINGPAAGLGFVLALYADVRFAASE